MIPISQLAPKSPSKRTTDNKGPLTYSAVSLFAGCGGLDLGFRGGFWFKNEWYKKHPFRIIKAYDFDERAVETYQQNIGQHITQADLSILPSNEIPKADLLIGGFPCQDFSSCGTHAGLGSRRGKLYKTLVRYMETHQPKMVVGENVPNLARMHNGSILKTNLKELEAPGYVFNIWHLYAPDYGVPQNRTRLIFVGVRKDLPCFPLRPPATHADSHRSIEWAIDDLKKISDESVSNQSQYFLASKAKRGNGQGDEKSKSGKPAYTVRANAKSRVQFHYSLDRRLTVRECARLQTFPDDFKFPHSATTNIMQIGNAVPPVLAHHVADAVAKCLTTLNHDLAAATPK
jgi:DNA (cytosine-5)-methyltransferase 1